MPCHTVQEELKELATIKGSLAVFCIATYGEGDPTDNATEMCDVLKRGDLDLAGLKYTVWYGMVWYGMV